MVLDGIVVLDLTRLLPGAVATQQLSDWGAEVIKVEDTRAGDYAREMNPPLFAATNRGKKSVSIDLKDARGRDVLLEMTRRADVLIEGNRPGVMDRLGLGYEALKSVNPKLIYCSLTGYGQSGPFAKLAGHDVNYMALGGVLGLNLPVIPGVQIADLVGGSMQAVTGILLALIERAQTGAGRFVDVSMYAGVKSLLTVPLAAWRATGREPEAGREILSGKYACYNLYQARDLRWLAVGALEPKFWADLCRRLSCEELIAQQFDPAQQPVKEQIASIFRTKPAVQWFEELGTSDCCVTLVRTVGEVAAEIERPTASPSPTLGQHTREVLQRFGLPSTQIEELQSQGVIR